MADPQALIDLVAQYADDVLARCSDEQTPLLCDGLDAQTGDPLRWEDHSLSNLACQQNFLRVLDALTALTDQMKLIVLKNVMITV